MLEWVRGFGLYASVVRVLGFTDVVGDEAYFATDEDAVAHLEDRGA